MFLPAMRLKTICTFYCIIIGNVTGLWTGTTSLLPPISQRYHLDILNVWKNRITKLLPYHNNHNHIIILNGASSLNEEEEEDSTLIKSSSNSLGKAICEYHQVTIKTSQVGVPPSQDINVEDVTPTIKALLRKSGMKNGVTHIISRHTTTAITINESESRLAKDMAAYFLSLAPPDERSSAQTAQHGTRYKHNDIHKRPDNEEEAERCRENGWDIDDPVALQQWRDQEPINAHSHLLSMLIGTSESIPVVDGCMVIGQWQSVLLIDFDGPRDRTLGIQFLGYQ